MTESAIPPSTSPPAGVQKPQASSALTPNPRSCVTCRRRKVKCDKQHPCSNCVRGKIDCVFPGPGRAPRKSRKPQDGELLERLRRLEGVVQTLNAQVEEHEQEAAERTRKQSAPSEPAVWCRSESNRNVAVDNASDKSAEELESRFGRLVIDQGRSRYVNSSFWASLNREVEDLKTILIEPSDDDEDTHASPDSDPTQHQSYIFGYSSANVDMVSLHPSPEIALEYWAIYKENVDPLVKVLHIPTFEPTLLDAFSHPGKVPKGLECFLFTIYYGAVTSLSNEECEQRWGEQRDAILSRYRFGLEQGLARANFLFADEMIILQAFVTFLILLRRNDDARKIWTLTGLAVRVSQTLGIHRDGTHFKLSPFETEMRRRLWWQVCVLDARASEDHGCDPTVIPAQFDTSMPLNVNDADLDPAMTEFPEERVGFTDMTFSLIRFEATNILRDMLYIPPGPNKCTEFFANLTIPEKEKWISDCHQRLEDKYLKNSDMTIPLFWVTATISRLIMSKMWLIVYHPYQRRDGGASLPQETKDKLFITSLENLEYSILLETEARTMKWGWLFRTYIQWHAIAFLLSELCVRTRGEAVERAWRALETSSSKWWTPLSDSDYRKGKQGCLWKPLRKLMQKARMARQRELAFDFARVNQRNGTLDYTTYAQLLSQTPPPSVGSPQPSPENVDKLLRPAAPRLGEMPTAKPPSWAGSPALPDWASAGDNDVNMLERNRVTRNPPSVSTDNSWNSSNFGVAAVISGNILNDETLASDLNTTQAGIAYQQPAQSGIGTFDDLSGFVQPIQQATAFPLDLNGTAFSNETLPDAVPTQESPLDSLANIDWTEWDEQVREFGFGMEGMQGTLFPPANASHLGGGNFF